MKSLSHSVIRKAFPLALSIAAAIPQIHAAIIVKDNNSSALDLGASWVGSTAPGTGDIASWTSTVVGANTVALGANADWQGIQISNPGGAVVVTHTAGLSLTLGSSGIDLSSATQNLTLLNTANTGTIAIGAPQTWNIASLRTLTLFNTSNTATTALTGSSDIQVSGAGSVAMNVGDATATAFSGGGNSGFSGNWTIGTGTAGSGRIVTLRNGVNAFGTGSITMNGGTIAQTAGNWSWANNISLATGTASVIEDANTSGTTRVLKLQGVISGSGNVTFNDPNSRMGVDQGFILTGNNTMSGTVTLGAGADVRVGGVPGNDGTNGAGTSGTLGTASVALSAATSTLTLSRTNVWTFANPVSGAGVLRVGLNTGSPQVVTVSGNNSHTGGTTIQSAVTVKIGHANALGTGTLTFAGSGTFDNATGSALSVANAITLSNGSPTFIGSNDMTFGGAVTLAGANRTITVNGSTLSLNGNVSGAFNLTKAGPGTLVLGGTNTQNATTVNGGVLALDYGVSDTSKLGDTSVLTLGAVELRMAGAGGAHVEAVLSTTLSGAARITRSGTNTAEISLGAITRNTGAFLDVQSASLADTSTANVNNVLQGVTLGGTDLAANDGANNIVAFAGYADLTRLESGTKTITSDATSQIRIVDGTGSAPAAITTAAAGATDVNNLVVSATGGSSTVDIGAGNTLRLGAAGSLISGTGTGGVTVQNGTFTAGGADNTAGDLQLATSASTPMTISAAIANNGSGAVTLTKTGNGTLVLSGANTHTGNTTVRGGMVELSGGAAISDSGAVILSNVAGASLKLNASEIVGNLVGGGPLGGSVDVGANTLTVTSSAGVQVLGGAVSGTGTIIKQGSGVLTLEGTNSFSGQYNITTGGGLAFRSLGADNGKPSVDVGTGTEFALGSELVGQTAIISALSGAGTVNPQFDATLGTKTLEVEQASNTVFSGVMRDSLTDARIIAFTKSGTGTLELSGANTFTGATTIDAGTLLVSGSLSGSSAVSVNGGTLAGDGPVGAITLNAGGTVAPGASPATLATGSLNFSGGTLSLELNGAVAGTDYDQLSATGTVAFSANTALTLSLGFDPVDGVDFFTIVANDLADSVSTGSGLFSFAGNPLSEGELFTAGAQDFTISYVGGDGNDIVLAAVPEPGSAVFLLGGIALMAVRRRRSAQG